MILISEQLSRLPKINVRGILSKYLFSKMFRKRFCSTKLNFFSFQLSKPLVWASHYLVVFIWPSKGILVLSIEAVNLCQLNFSCLNCWPRLELYTSGLVFTYSHFALTKRNFKVVLVFLPNPDPAKLKQSWVWHGCILNGSKNN